MTRVIYLLLYTISIWYLCLLPRWTGAFGKCAPARCFSEIPTTSIVRTCCYFASRLLPSPIRNPTSIPLRKEKTDVLNRP